MGVLNDPGRGAREEEEGDSGESPTGEDEPRVGVHIMMEEEEGDSDEEDQDDHGGYQPLPQDPEQARDEEDMDEGDMEEGRGTSLALGPPQLSESTRRLAEESRQAREREETEERARLWASASDKGESRSSSIVLDEAKLSAIRSAMSSLRPPPAEAVPAWAKGLREEEWREALRKRLENSSEADKKE